MMAPQNTLMNHTWAHIYTERKPPSQAEKEKKCLLVLRLGEASILAKDVAVVVHAADP